MLPVSLTLELIFKGVYPDQDYAIIGRGIIISLIILLVTISIAFLLKFNQQLREFKNYKPTQVLIYMILLQFVVHPLVFYINLSSNWSKAEDGQFILSINETFQMSSFAFLILGLLIDGLKLIQLKNTPNDK
ncbi:MAG: hypothetical protein IT236_14305 [Bacteroidia bacterium]|nr:hypothetical protein [Bacteroidia bacterium]